MSHAGMPVEEGVRRRDKAHEEPRAIATLVMSRILNYGKLCFAIVRGWRNIMLCAIFVPGCICCSRVWEVCTRHENV